jgi:glycosyltransferase involved in cell wall biosynthesis
MYWIPSILILPYFFLLLKIYRSLLKIKSFRISEVPGTFVSVIVACRNEQDNIPSLIDNISGQNYPKGLFEVIIVDDNSTDRTFETVAGLMRNNIRIIKNSGKGKKQALRTGIESSSGQLIVTTDADCRMGNNWISTIAAFYEKFKPDLIICPVQIVSDQGFFGKFQELEFLSLQGITAGSAYSGKATMCNGANLAFKREGYLANSGNLHFEIPSGDDIFLLHSLKREKQSKILWLESIDAIVTTTSSPSLLSFIKQRMRWISKAKIYTDGNTILLGIVTFVTIFLQVSLIIAGFFKPDFLLGYLTIFFIKSIPDFLILLNTSCRYGKRKLMTWFIPAQVIYPFYVLGIVVCSLILKLFAASYEESSIP